MVVGTPLGSIRMSRDRMKVIVLVCAVYPPEPLVSAYMCQDLALRLLATGYNPIVVCPQPSRPIGADYSAWSAKGRILSTMENGVTVVRLPSYVSPKSGFFARARESCSFGWQSSRFLKDRTTVPAAIFLSGWPIFSKALTTWFAERRGVPVVLSVMDVYPESLLEKLPRALRTAIGWPLLAVDRWTARRAAMVVVISEYMRRLYAQVRNVPSDRLALVRVWQDERRFEVMPAHTEACRRYGVRNDRFTFLFLGNVGPVAGVDLLIRAMAMSRLEGTAQLIIAGDGSAKEDCQRLAQEMGAKNVIFISDPEMGNVAALHALGHVCMLPMKRGTGTTSVPSKLAAYLLAGRPVIATVDADSDIAAMVSEADAGWVGPAEDIEWLSATMQKTVSLDEAELLKKSGNGRRYGLAVFSRAAGGERLAEIVRAAAEAKGPSV